MVEKKIILMLVIIFTFLSFCSAIDYSWTLTNGVILSTDSSFTGKFIFPGKYVLILIASIGELKASRDMTFYVAYEEGGYCIDGQSWLVGNEDNPLFPSNNDCYRSDGINRIYCCEKGKLCDKDSGKCSDVINTNYISCVDYKDKDSCENDIYGIAEYSIEEKVENENFCGSVVNRTGNNYIYASDCLCKWDEISNLCISSWDELTYDMEKEEIISSGTCELTTSKVVGDCSKDEFRIEYLTGIWTGTSERPNSCPESSEQKIPCGGIISLDFFSWVTFIVSLSIIFIIYYIFLKNKTKK